MRLKVISIGLMLILIPIFSSGCKDGEIGFRDSKAKEVVLIKENKDEDKKIEKKEIKNEEETIKDQYEVYINPRFGYSLSYPNKFKITKESDNGDGVELSYEDSKIIVYGTNNVLQDSAKSLYEDELKEIPKKNITENFLEKNTYVIRWKEGNFIKYKKSTVGEESINSFEIVYPANKEKEFIDMIRKVNESFKTPNVDKMG